MDPLVDGIYDAALRPDAWHNVLAGIAELLGAKDISIGAFDAERGLHEGFNLPIDPAFQHSYAAHWSTRNFLWDASAGLPPGQTFVFESFLPRAELERSELYGEWFQPQKMEVVLGANLLVNGPVSSAITVYRPQVRGAFDSAEIARFRRLLPHLQRCIEIRSRLADAKADAADLRVALSILRKAALVVDKQSRICYANVVAEHLLLSGSLLTSRDGSLCGYRPDDTSALQRLIYTTVYGADGAGGRIVLQRRDGRPLTLLVARLHGAHSVFARPSALILIDDPQPMRAIGVSDALIRAHYGLTKSEARLALTLAEGTRLRAAAAKLGISFATARTHLAHIFHKTQVTTQADLLTLILRSGLDC